MSQIMSQIEKRLETIGQRIDSAARRAGRKPEEISLMAVTKLHPKESIEAAYQAGIRLFGENRVQEAEEKYTGFYPDAELHIIGHLQSNKAKKVVGLASCVQSIDKLKTAMELEKRCAAEDISMGIYLEVNTSGEESKSGYLSSEAMYSELEEIALLKHLRVEGLMTIGPLTEEEKHIRDAFSGLRELFEETRNRYPELPLRVLSMGMTSDFETAIEEGSTMVRIGSAIFGQRNY
ncbi:MAG: YggS family pyridoxal phosphate-dependent enzyme [Spirochaetaceae bacterium]